MGKVSKAKKKKKPGGGGGGEKIKLRKKTEIRAQEGQTKRSTENFSNYQRFRPRWDSNPRPPDPKSGALIHCATRSSAAKVRIQTI